jgi:hypothetical protein
MRSILIALCPLAAFTTPGFSQSRPAESRYSAGWADVAAVSAAGVTTLVPKLLIPPRGPPSCVPCSPAGLPGIDRWVVGANSSVAQRGSDVLLPRPPQAAGPLYRRRRGRRTVRQQPSVISFRHTCVAFAIATSYLVIAQREDLGCRASETLTRGTST